LQNRNEQIDANALNVRIADQLIELGTQDEQFCVAVNSFGYGGSNAHVILQTPPKPGVPSQHLEERTPVAERTRLPRLLPISARSQKALAEYARRIANTLANGESLEDVLYTASMRRAHLSERAVIAGSNRKELIDGLNQLSDNKPSPQIYQGSQPFQGKRLPVLVFTGMGPQWWGMGQELYQRETIYRKAVERADQEFQDIAGFSPLSEMLKGESDSEITKTEFAQPANLLLQIGIWELLKAAGVQPGAVVGHSVGELASAYVSGALTLKEAVTVCYWNCPRKVDSGAAHVRLL
jgi:acyl transferase domain-containing protein